MPGGAIRARHTLTNLGRQPYIVDSLDVVFPLPGRVGEILDFTGRQTAERVPQRHKIGDGLWLREGRRGHTGHDSATVLVAGVPGFTFGSGRGYGLHVAWSGNTVHRVERVPPGLGIAGDDADPRGPGARGDHYGGGELLLPGEIALAKEKSYTPRGSLSPRPGPALRPIGPVSRLPGSLPAHRARPAGSTSTFWKTVSPAGRPRRTQWHSPMPRPVSAWNASS